MITERHFGWPTRYPTSKKTGTGSNAIFRKILSNYAIGKWWVDPMCGHDDRCEFRNDIRAKGTAANHVGDALEWLKSLPTAMYEGVVNDPPYNDAQGEKYTKLHVSKSDMKYWWSIRAEIARIVRPGGLVILFAWNTNGFTDLKAGNIFDIERIWVIAHGSERNDTLVSVHRKRL